MALRCENKIPNEKSSLAVANSMSCRYIHEHIFARKQAKKEDGLEICRSNVGKVPSTY